MPDWQECGTSGTLPSPCCHSTSPRDLRDLGVRSPPGHDLEQALPDKPTEAIRVIPAQPQILCLF